MIASRTRSWGFTLLELLVAMTLLALLSGLLFGGLSFGVRVWEKGDAELEKLAELQIAQSLVRRVISRALSSELAEDEGQDAGTLLGTVDGLRLVGPAPAQSLPGGIYQLSLRLDEAQEKRRLVMGWRLLRPRDEDSETDEDEKDKEENIVVLVDDVAEVTFAYFGVADQDAGPEWWDRWENVPGLPQLVHIEITFNDGDTRIWPELTVAPMIAAPVS